MFKWSKEPQTMCCDPSQIRICKSRLQKQHETPRPSMAARTLPRCLANNRDGGRCSSNAMWNGYCGRPTHQRQAQAQGREMIRPQTPPPPIPHTKLERDRRQKANARRRNALKRNDRRRHARRRAALKRDDRRRHPDHRWTTNAVALAKTAAWEQRHQRTQPWGQSHYPEYRWAQLKALCQKRGLKSSGTMAELISYLNNRQTAANATNRRH